MEDYIKTTKQKIKQLEREINESSASHNEKRNMQHSISKVNIFFGDVCDQALFLKKKLEDKESELTSVKEQLQNKEEGI